MTQEHQYNDDSTRAVFIPAPGAELAQYRIDRKLGAGGMGDVYLATDTRLRRRVALKFLSAQFTTDPAFRQRFIREAQSAAALNHPNVVTIFEVAEHESQAFIAMEYVSGRSLQDIAERGGMPADSVVDLMIQACDGIGAAHAAGMVHRDIKPANIILGDDGRVRILDFGLARIEQDERLTRAGMAMGTVNYMSPEQAEGRDVDLRSDVFALGVVLYEMLGGRSPFKKANLPATLHAVVHDNPTPLADLAPALPPELVEVIGKAMTKNPTRRQASAAELAEELRAAVGQVPPGAATATFGSTRQTATTPRAAGVRALAVLYLRNLGSSDDEFLSYGITEDLIVDLTRVGTVRVSPMRSIMKYKDSDADLEEIAHNLNVGLILDGSIHKAGETIRVSAQLVDVATGDNLWAGRWENSVDDLPTIKQALAKGVTGSLKIGESVVLAAEVGRPEASDHEAYESYLRGKYAFENKKDTADVEIALGLFRQALKQEPGLLAARAGIAEVFLHRGDAGRALEEIESALADARDQDHKADEAMLLRLAARYHIKQSEWSLGLEYAEKSAALARDLRDIAGEAEAIGCQIAALQPQAKFDDALRLFDRLLEISRRLEDQERIGDALKSMGVVYARKGDFDRALDLYQEAMALGEDQNNVSLQAACYSNIGNVYYFRGDFDKAFGYYRQAFELHIRLGDRAMAARPRLNMGLIELQRGRHSAGLEILNEAGDAFKELGDRSTYAMTLMNISHIRLTLGETEEALKAARSALGIAQEIHHPLAESDAIIRLANIHFYERDLDLAAENYLQALKIAEAAGLSRNVSIARLRLAELHYYRKEWDTSRGFAKQSQAVAREIGEKPIASQAAAILGALTARDGMYFAGLRQVQRYVEEAERDEDIERTVHLKALLGQLLLEAGRGDEDRTNGRKILDSALEIAVGKKLSPEILWIEEILHRA